MKSENFNKAKVIESSIAVINANIGKIEAALDIFEPANPLSQKPILAISYESYSRSCSVDVESLCDFLTLQLKKNERNRAKLQKEFDNL